MAKKRSEELEKLLVEYGENTILFNENKISQQEFSKNMFEKLKIIKEKYWKELTFKEKQLINFAYGIADMGNKLSHSPTPSLPSSQEFKKGLKKRLQGFSKLIK